MSVWFKSYIAYGVKMSYDRFEELGIDPRDDDNDLIGNNPDKIGWDVDGMSGEFAFFGCLVHDGEDNGNDTPLGGEGGANKLELLNDSQIRKVKDRVIHELGHDYEDKTDYYVIGMYS